MKEDEVPQDNISTYAGHQKLLYAVDKNGSYTGVQSTGWQVEGEATLDAIEQINKDRLDAWQRVQDGQSSCLEFHMYNCRMDVALLAQTSGFFQWRIRRHFKPKVFHALSDSILNRYCEALNLSRKQLLSTPDTPDFD
ncbi:hypothetical protein NBRC116493_31860 [Aurantivibrio infirmus]